MLKAKYGIGDIVVLRDGPLRHARTGSEFRILAVLPDADGQVQYRVRSEVEGFDRRVGANDIDSERSAVSKTAAQAPTDEGGREEPWFKPSSIKIGK
jgi:hypothetical protein